MVILCLRGALHVSGRVRKAFCALAVCAFFGAPGFAQKAEAANDATNTTPLSELLTEAERNNPQIRSAQQGAKAAKNVPAQVSALPDPTVPASAAQCRQPAAVRRRYTNSEFAYIGLGASQDILYPGKLRLKALSRGATPILLPAGPTRSRSECLGKSRLPITSLRTFRRPSASSRTISSYFARMSYPYDALIDFMLA